MSRYRLQEIAEQYRGRTIGIIGNGPTVIYRNESGAITGKADFSKYPHPIWVINGGWAYHNNATLAFLMDDVKGPALAEHPTPDWYMGQIRNSLIPIVTSKAYPEFPALVEYPLGDIMRIFRSGYFAESINYMIAFAVLIGVKRIEFFGADYMNARPQERASTEHWAGIAHGMGLFRTFLKALAEKDKKFAKAFKNATGLAPEGLEEMGCEIVVSPLSEMMKARYDETYYMPGFYGYNKESFPLTYEARGGPANVNVKLDARFGELWWKPESKEAAA